MSPRLRLLVALISTGMIGYIAVGSLLGRVLGDSTYAQLSIFNEVVRLVIDAYVEPVNLDRAMTGARLGMTDALDGDSAYLDPDEFRAWQQASREQEADVGLLLSRRFSFLIVASTRANSPAERAGVKAGDLIKTIDGRHTRPMPAPVGQRLLRGAPGSTVKLTLLRHGNDPLDVSLVRERLQPVPARGRMIDPGIGYLKVAEVAARTAEELRGELGALRRSGARSLVLDLRGNGHGELEEGVRVAELFLKGGVVAKLTGARHGEQVLSADPRQTAWDGPLAVLIDHGTAGAAEIATAALLDAERATVVGLRSFGRAPLLKAFPLPEGGLVVTVARYVSPKGNAIHSRGVEPSIPVEMPATDDLPEDASRDLILEKALEALRGEGKKAA